MCGIGGQVRTQPEPFFDSSHWLSNLKQRGPDATGEYKSDRAKLIHTRLSIVDPSSSSNQPMILNTKAGKIVLCFNGEIYNFRQLRALLQSTGVTFSTCGEAEVLLKLYERFGLEFLSHLNGMFSISILDESNKKLILARDRLGIKPLYYTRDKSSFLFCSNIHPLVQSTSNKALNDDAIDSYLHLRYNAFDESFFKGIHKLPEASLLELNLDDLTYRIEKYWSFPNVNPNPFSFSESCDHFDELLTDAIRLRCQSDSTMGAFLSGGIDSSVIVDKAAVFRTDLNIHSIFTGGGPDEVPLAEHLSKRLNCRFFPVEIDDSDTDRIGSITKALQEPIGDSIIFPTWKLANSASNHSKVILSGEGADEILGGYIHHDALYKANLLKNLFPWLGKPQIIKILTKLPSGFWEKFFPYPSRLGSSGIKRLILFLGSIEHPFRALMNLVSLFPDTSENEFLLTPINSGNDCTYEKLNQYWRQIPQDNVISKITRFDLKFWNPNYTLHRLDRLTMDNSIEARVPFLDHRLVEFTLSLPDHFKKSLFHDKIILRECAKRKSRLGPEVYSRKKQAFYFPVPSHFKLSLNMSGMNSLSEKYSKIEQFSDLSLSKNDRSKDLLNSKKWINLVILSHYLNDN